MCLTHVSTHSFFFFLILFLSLVSQESQIYSHSLVFIQRFFTDFAQRPQAREALCSSARFVCDLETTFKIQITFMPAAAFTFHQALLSLFYACGILCMCRWLGLISVSICTQPLVNLERVESLSNPSSLPGNLC